LHLKSDAAVVIGVNLPRVSAQRFVEIGKGAIDLVLHEVEFCAADIDIRQLVLRLTGARDDAAARRDSYSGIAACSFAQVVRGGDRNEQWHDL
jgi:hypothetical protein